MVVMVFPNGNNGSDGNNGSNGNNGSDSGNNSGGSNGSSDGNNGSNGNNGSDSGNNSGGQKVMGHQMVMTVPMEKMEATMKTMERMKHKSQPFHRLSEKIGLNLAGMRYRVLLIMKIHQDGKLIHTQQENGSELYQYKVENLTPEAKYHFEIIPLRVMARNWMMTPLMYGISMFNPSINVNVYVEENEAIV